MQPAPTNEPSSLTCLVAFAVIKFVEFSVKALVEIMMSSLFG